jgi:glycosyltransferase involved in cell wall biosynthesis
LTPSRLVSIVITAYNNWPDLELAIQSALNQSYRTIEVIVVDNASTDATAQRVPELFGERVHYVIQPNTGEGGGRNAGFRLAHGELVQFLDGDDVLAPDKIEKQVAVFSCAPEVDIVYGDVRQFQTAAGHASFLDWDSSDHEDMLSTLISPSGNGGGLLPDSMLFRRGALERVGQWLESSPEMTRTGNAYCGADQDYWLRAAWSGCRFKHCPGSLCFYRRRSGQLTSDPWAAARGMEPPLTRAQSYITKEPYRSAVAKRLAHLLMILAIGDPKQSVDGSLAKLRKARGLSPEVVTSSGFAIAAMVIRLRIGPFLFGSWMKPIRRIAKKLTRTRIAS